MGASSDKVIEVLKGHFRQNLSLITQKTDKLFDNSIISKLNDSQKSAFYNEANTLNSKLSEISRAMDDLISSKHFFIYTYSMYNKKFFF